MRRLAVAAALLAGCGDGAACADWHDAVDGCLDRLEAATGVDMTEARPDAAACPGDDADEVWTCRAAAYATSSCDDVDALPAIQAELAACEPR